MECKLRLNWLLLAVICPLITCAPSSLSKASCSTENIFITGGRFVLSNGYSHGSIVRYSCPQGFYPDVKKRQCRNGSWDPHITKKKSAECKMVTCPNPHVFENGRVTPYKVRYFVNDTTDYSCNSDYTFRGSAHRVCQHNGKWSGDTPVCGRDSDHCPDPGVPPGSYRDKNTFNIDDKITYSCDNKLILIGSKQRVCEEGGQWSGTEPQCYTDFTFDTPEEASRAFSSSLKTNLVYSKQYEEPDQVGKKIRLEKGGKLDIYIAVDASDSIDVKEFNKAKDIIKTLIDAISYYEVSPNYEILMFATDVTPIVTMRNFKSMSAENNLEIILQKMDNFTYETKGERSGTNIAKAYHRILDSMGVEKAKDEKGFLQTQHVVIMFTDGNTNMGGSPKPKVDEIRHMVTQNDPKRENKLDLYVFGVGEDVKKESLNELVSKKEKEVHYFLLPDLAKVQETFDKMLDESTVLELCGIQHKDTDEDKRRREFPWLAQIKVKKTSIVTLTCMGSLVTPTYILTAAHCFKTDNKEDISSISLKRGLYVEAERIILHPKYNLLAKKHIGIPEYYEFDVALIQLTKAVKLDQDIRTICIPCTKESSGALKLSESEATCTKHKEIIMGPDLVNAHFTSEMKPDDNTPYAIREITIKQRGLRDACVEDALKADEIKKSSNKSLNAKDIVTDNFLCSGGIDPETDHISCKGDSGGATYLYKNRRVIQVGVVSWGSKDKCEENTDILLSDADSRDYHTNLFGPEIRSFLKKHLGNKDETKGAPLTFLD